MPEMRIWSILLIKSDLKMEYTLYILAEFFFVFQLLRTRKSQGAHEAKFYSRLRVICSVLRASKLSVFKID